MDFKAYYSTGMGTKHVTDILTVHYWDGKRVIKDAVNRGHIARMFDTMLHDECFVIKPDGTLITTSNPLLIYGEQIVSIIQYGSEFIYNSYSKSIHVEAITNDFINQAV